MRSGTAILDEDEQSEKIINDIVAMDAAFDPHQLPDLSLGNKNLFSSGRQKQNVKAEKYGNFHTIDWLRDLVKDRFRHRWLMKEKRRGKLFEKVQAWHDACSGWFCVLLVGISAGYNYNNNNNNNNNIDIKIHIYLLYLLFVSSNLIMSLQLLFQIKGIVAGIVDIGSGWTANLKSGFCASAFWLNRDQCCWSSRNSSFDSYRTIQCDEVIIYFPLLII